MTKKFKSLVLTKDTVFDESIEVDGNITCEGGRWSLKVIGNIVALDIVTGNIDAENIDAMDIVCEKRTKKTTKAKTFARIFIQNRSKNKRKEW